VVRHEVELGVHRHPGDPARGEQPLVAGADHGVGEGEPRREPADGLCRVQHHPRPRFAGRAQGVEVDEPSVGGLHHADRDHVVLRRPLADAVERALDDRDAPVGLRGERERDTGALPRRHEHPGTVGHRGRHQPDQRRDRPTDRDPVDRHAHQVGERRSPGLDGRVEVRRPAGAPAPARNRLSDGVGDRDRGHADAGGVEVAVGEVERLAERLAHGTRR
jgi:hypothetical protein